MACELDRTDNTIIVGIDFGTTYSGVAFTWSNKIERLEVVSSWESDIHSNFDEEKAPTALSFGSNGKVNWGYSIPYDVDQVKWFKLLLIDEEDLPEDVRSSAKIEQARAYLKKHNKTAIEVIALFLRHLWNHTTQRITETVSRNLVNFSKFHIVITLPAIWPDYARNRMREAASDAGMLAERTAGDTELSFISEPEAAALVTLADMEGRNDIKVGDSFVVVDCGGGDLCGSVFVDEAFIEIAEIRHRLFHDKWEHGIKPAFDGMQRVWNLNMPFECVDVRTLIAGGSLPKITLTSGDVESAFRPTVDKICRLVGEQVTAYIIMVGGFGRCRHLLTALKEISGDIEVLQSRGSGPWTAICRGAVIHAASLRGISTFSVKVESRIARASYGLVQWVSWNPAVHNPVDKVWDEDEQAWKAKDQMGWLIKMGEELSGNNTPRIEMHCLYPIDETAKKPWATDIYISSAWPPPTRFNERVTKLCDVQWETEIDMSTLPTCTNPLGKVFYDLNYDVALTCSG
ncbi:actin-like ATPase domain-containing protein [Canariomyces notabilis]|uniref:Actin-like ATPase domain-containing protein n=1 Tax=Canariomyces notabilis TaxID=2074819 RepID=A0AAN6TAL9_9PEZI|nr:actin-like ATPase domain-containing protein [Canariomyces arenarius]